MNTDPHYRAVTQAARAVERIMRPIYEACSISAYYGSKYDAGEWSGSGHDEAEKLEAVVAHDVAERFDVAYCALRQRLDERDHDPRNFPGGGAQG